jgi:2,3-dihydroxybenzoate-AMP ligase
MSLPGVTPFPPEYARRYRERGYWRDVALRDVFFPLFDRHAERVAIVTADERITYGEVGKRSERLARHLHALGVRPLDRMVVHLPNIPEFVYLYFALQRLGAIPLMALPPHRRHEIAHYVDFIDAVGYAVPDRVGRFDFVELAREISREARSLRFVLVAGEAPAEPGFVAIRDLLAREPGASGEQLDGLEIDPDDPCVFQLSGGTTGLPKIIPRSHNDYVYNSEAIARFNDIRADDALLIVIPIAHNFPLASPGLQGFFLAGARIVLATSVRGEDVLPLIAATGVTHLELAPALVIRWLNEIASEPALAGLDLSSVRIINTGGQKFQPETKARAERSFSNATVQEIFGMAEGLLMITRLDDPEEVRFDTVGRPVCPDDELKLVDDDLHQVAPGELGELLVRGPYTLRGYYNVPEVNARQFTDDGFYRSGDVMRLHPSGNYVVEGRKKDLINRGGEKISAEEVEDMILTHPAVAQVACVPMPDPVLGERTCAYVAVRRGDSLTLEDLTGFLTRKGLARFKHPERLEVRDDLPLSPFGKVKKNELAARIAQEVGEPRSAGHT